jgi:hypothetical protein
MCPGPFTSPVALSVPFDNATNGFTSIEVQSAIEEARQNAEGRSRFMANCGFDGNSSVGRYLEYNSNVDSNISGLVLPRACHLWEISLVHTANSAVTYQVLSWNGVTETLITSISTTASQRKNYTTGLNIALAAGTELRVKDTAGSCTRPIVYKWFIFD